MLSHGTGAKQAIANERSAVLHLWRVNMLQLGVGTASPRS